MTGVAGSGKSEGPATPLTKVEVGNLGNCGGLSAAFNDLLKLNPIHEPG